MPAEPTLVLPKIAECPLMDYSTVAQHHSTINKLAERADSCAPLGLRCLSTTAWPARRRAPLMLRSTPEMGSSKTRSLADRKCSRQQHPCAARPTVQQCRR